MLNFKDYLAESEDKVATSKPKNVTPKSIAKGLLKQVNDKKTPLVDRVTLCAAILMALNDDSSEIVDHIDGSHIDLGDVDIEDIVEEFEDLEIPNEFLELLKLNDDGEYIDATRDADFLETNLKKIISLVKASDFKAIKELFDKQVQEMMSASERAAQLAKEQKIKEAEEAKAIEHFVTTFKLTKPIEELIKRQFKLPSNTKISIPKEWVKYYNKRTGEVILQIDDDLTVLPFKSDGTLDLKRTPYILIPYDKSNRRDSGRMPLNGYMYIRQAWTK